MVQVTLPVRDAMDDDGMDDDAFNVMQGEKVYTGATSANRARITR